MPRDWEVYHTPVDDAELQVYETEEMIRTKQRLGSIIHALIESNDYHEILSPLIYVYYNRIIDAAIESQRMAKRYETWPEEASLV